MSKYVKIDKEKLETIIEERNLTKVQVSEMLGYSHSYVSNCICKKEILLRKAKLLCLVLKCELEDIAYEEPKKITPIVTAPAATKQYGDGEVNGYSAEVKVFPDRVLLKFYFGGAEIGHGYSRIKGDDELALFQAFSYAAHMVYKNKEQEVLESEDF